MTDRRTTFVDTIDGARMSAHRIWIGALLTSDEAVDRVRWAMLDDERASGELACCGEWLLASSEYKPLASHTRQLIQLLAASATLDGDPN